MTTQGEENERNTDWTRILMFAAILSGTGSSVTTLVAKPDGGYTAKHAEGDFQLRDERLDNLRGTVIRQGAVIAEQQIKIYQLEREILVHHGE